MATQLSLVNRILRRLREDQVTTIVDNEYATLIAEFVNDAYEDVVEELDWGSLSHEIIVDLVDGTDTYNLSATVAGGGGVRTAGNTRLCKFDSLLEYFDVIPQIFIYEDANDDNGYPPTVLTPEEFRLWEAQHRTNTSDNPCVVTFYPSEDNTTLNMQLYPEPDAARELRARFITKPDELALDGTDDATVIICPDRPVYLLALMYAYNERGEEIGEPGNIAEARYNGALTTAKEAAIRLRERANFYDWRRD